MIMEDLVLITTSCIGHCAHDTSPQSDDELHLRLEEIARFEHCNNNPQDLSRRWHLNECHAL